MLILYYSEDLNFSPVAVTYVITKRRMTVRGTGLYFEMVRAEQVTAEENTQKYDRNGLSSTKRIHIQIKLSHSQETDISHLQPQNPDMQENDKFDPKPQNQETEKWKLLPKLRKTTVAALRLIEGNTLLSQPLLPA
ncbi:hypothetical protein JTB14_022278 [Gonioctena quinquepunctata]|nr:hypothetical protein JTB14_022278 [Gonioctena quinquepunctata]